MTIMLDTHAFLWSVFSPGHLSLPARKAITNANDSVCVSAVSFWEISLKTALGKMELHGVQPDDLPDVAGRMGFEVLPLDAGDAASFHALPRQAHRDPFDRMLVHQAIRRHWQLVSCDTALDVYAPLGLKRLW
jgi:PIN domain nuclease of toxin-antitoxin system